MIDKHLIWAVASVLMSIILTTCVFNTVEVLMGR